MEPTKSIEIIEGMLLESKKSLHRNSFYFLVWGFLLVPAGIAEYYLQGKPLFMMIWPIVGMVGGVISMLYGRKESKRVGAETTGDRVTSYTWGAFLVTMFIGIGYTTYNGLSPHTIILLLAGMATFISGGISKFTPFVIGGILLQVAGIICAFVLEPSYHSLVFSAGIFVGYVIPGILLRRSENV